MSRHRRILNPVDDFANKKSFNESQVKKVLELKKTHKLEAVALIMGWTVARVERVLDIYDTERDGNIFKPRIIREPKVPFNFYSDNL